MKKNKLSVIALAILAVVLSFAQCTNDEADETVTKVEILKEKAKQLSKKYGIEVTLNEEEIEKVADTLTFEQMERDFQQIAALNGTEIISTPTPRDRQKTRLRIKKDKTIEEERDADYSGSTTMSASCLAYYKNRHGYDVSHRFEGEATIQWQYALKKATWAKVSLDMVIDCGGTSCTGSGTLEPTFTLSPRFAFTATGKVPMNTSFYNYVFHVVVNYSSDGNSSIYLSV